MSHLTKAIRDACPDWVLTEITLPVGTRVTSKGEVLSRIEPVKYTFLQWLERAIDDKIEAGAESLDGYEVAEEVFTLAGLWTYLEAYIADGIAERDVDAPQPDTHDPYEND